MWEKRIIHVGPKYMATSKIHNGDYYSWFTPVELVEKLDEARESYDRCQDKNDIHGSDEHQKTIDLILKELKKRKLLESDIIVPGNEPVIMILKHTNREFKDVLESETPLDLVKKKTKRKTRRTLEKKEASKASGALKKSKNIPKQLKLNF